MDFQPLSSALALLAGMTTKVNEREFNKAIIELQKALTEIQRQAVELQQENLTLRDENRQLKEQLSGQALEFDGYTYWKKTDSGFDGPYCSVCSDKMNQKIRLTHVLGVFHRDTLRYDCAAHKESFLIPRHVIALHKGFHSIPSAT